MSIIFEIPKETMELVKEHCKQYETMTLEELKQVVCNLDQSENKIFSKSDLLQTKEQILDFLYGWTWRELMY